MARLPAEVFDLGRTNVLPNLADAVALARELLWAALCFDRAVNVLAIDGGGVRGIVPAAILARWESEGELPVYDRFKLFAGTSTGAILATALAAGMSAAALLELFKNDTPAIFTLENASFVKKALSYKGIVLPAYSSRALRGSLEAKLGDMTLGECPRPLMIASLDVVSGSPKIFRSGHFKRGPEDSNVRLVDAILASTAAPVLFPSVQVGLSTYVDGALWANNPALLAMIEAASLDDGRPNILSLGCGRPLWGGKFGYGTKRGLIGWSLPLLPLLMSSQSDGVDLYMRSLMAQDRYMRIDPALPRHLAPIDRVASLPELETRAVEAALEAISLLNERFRMPADDRGKAIVEGA